MRSDFVDSDIIGHILYALTPENKLVCKIALETGLRVGDILSFRTADLQKQSFTITEQKTGKKRRVRLRKALIAELLKIAGQYYVFEHRLDPMKHRTRQAVFADVKRSAKLFRVKENISPHSLRKIYAVDLYKKTDDITRVCEALSHDNELTTMIYALADIITKKQKKG
jgi:integrase